mmetsp:Transcript_41522/g.98408  ORF Transcript_41522/g.98408 Transcript_41522/m.98408 type:complete len:88 (-) Transcript_41522:66-329(-)
MTAATSWGRRGRGRIGRRGGAFVHRAQKLRSAAGKSGARQDRFRAIATAGGAIGGAPMVGFVPDALGPPLQPPLAPPPKKQKMGGEN